LEEPLSGVYLHSLKSRIRAMNTLWERAILDVTLEQVNHHERPGVLPIAFSLSHALRVQDRAIGPYFLDRPSVWEQGEWAKRIGVSVDRMGTGEAVSEMELLRFGNLAAWGAYQSEVIATTNTVLETLEEETLQDIVIAEVPETWNNFMALMVGVGNPVRKLDILESWVYQHGLRHLGELEHARALVGLGGLAG
jgi:hypothetical protein